MFAGKLVPRPAPTGLNWFYACGPSIGLGSSIERHDPQAMENLMTGFGSTPVARVPRPEAPMSTNGDEHEDGLECGERNREENS